RSGSSRLEGFHSLKRLKQRFLDKVVSVRDVARPSGQSAAGPATKRGQIAAEEHVDGHLVSRAGADQKARGRLGTRVSRRRTTDVGPSRRRIFHGIGE